MLAEECHAPIKVHYVWAGNEKIDDYSNAKINCELNANYPVVIYNQPTINVSTTYQEGAYDISAPLTRSATNGKDLYVITANLAYENLGMDGLVEAQDITTGLEDVALGKGTLRVYPNPATSMVTLQAPITITNVKIFTIDGQLVKEFDADDTKVRFNVSDLNAGVYIIHAAETTTRLIKK